MKISKVLIFLLAGTSAISAQAAFEPAGAGAAPAYTYFELGGTFTSISVSMPGAPDLVASYDPVSPTWRGNIWMEINSILAGNVGNWTDLGHSVNLTASDGRSATVTYPNNLIYGTYAHSYDPVSRTLTLHNGAAEFYNRSWFCLGAVSLCGGMYSPTPSESSFLFPSKDTLLRPIESIAIDGSLDMVLTFSTDFRAFSGTGSMVQMLRNGTVITEQFTIVGTYVPVPAAGWLLGSGLMGLAGGAVRRRLRRASASVE